MANLDRKRLSDWHIKQSTIKFTIFIQLEVFIQSWKLQTITAWYIFIKLKGPLGHQALPLLLNLNHNYVTGRTEAA